MENIIPECEKSENIRFITLIDTLKKEGLISDYVGIASVLGTNKAGISDIKYGRKKLSIEMIRSMKISYPQISIEWIVMGSGSMFIDQNSLSDKENLSLINRLIQQAEEIGKLKQEIEQLKEGKNSAAIDVRNVNAG